MIRLAAVFAGVFGNLDERSARTAVINDTEGWDSLAHIQLMMEVESAFGVQFSPEEVSAAGSFAAIVELLTKAGK